MARGLARTPDGGRAFARLPGVRDCLSRHRRAWLTTAASATSRPSWAQPACAPLLARAAARAPPAGRRRLPRLPRTGGDPRGSLALGGAARRRVRGLPRRPAALRARRRVARDAHGARRPRPARAQPIAPARVATRPGVSERSTGATAIGASTHPPAHAGQSGSPAPRATPCTSERAARPAACCARHPCRPLLARRVGRARPQRRLPPLPHARHRRRARRAPRRRR